MYIRIIPQISEQQRVAQSRDELLVISSKTLTDRPLNMLFGSIVSALIAGLATFTVCEAVGEIQQVGRSDQPQA